MVYFLFIKQKAAIAVVYHLQILFSGKDRAVQTFASFPRRTLTLLIWLWYLSEKYVMDTVEMIWMCGSRLSFSDPKMHTAVYIRIISWSINARSRNWSSFVFPLDFCNMLFWLCQFYQGIRTITRNSMSKVLPHKLFKIIQMILGVFHYFHSALEVQRCPVLLMNQRSNKV